MSSSDDLLPKQGQLFGGPAVPAPDVEYTPKVTHVLAKYPAARDDYKVCQVWFWWEFDNFHGLLEELFAGVLRHLVEGGGLEEGRRAWLEWARDLFLAWYTRQATSTKTIRNRQLEIQKVRSDLAPSPETQEKWAKQSKAGPIP